MTACLLLCPHPHSVSGFINLQGARMVWQTVRCLVRGIQKLRVLRVRLSQNSGRKDKQSWQQYWVVRVGINHALGTRDWGWPGRSEVPWISRTGENNCSSHLFGAYFELGVVPRDSLCSKLGTIFSSILYRRNKLCMVGVITQPTSKSHFCLFPALWPWASHITSLCLSSHTWKMRILQPPPHRVLVTITLNLNVKYLLKCAWQTMSTQKKKKAMISYDYCYYYDVICWLASCSINYTQY